MDRKFYCDTCGMSFLSWHEMKKHFQSKKHKDRFGVGRTELIIEKFAKCFKRDN